MIAINKLQNGVRMVTETIPFVRSVSFGIWVKNGSRNETAATSGMSHFIEHMLFKGTHKRTAREIADQMDAIGGQLNAFTSKDHTCYFARTLDAHFDTALDVLGDMFFNSKYDQAEIDKERNVILEEISMYEDTPEDLVVDLLHEKSYPGQTLGVPILGSPESIGTFTSDDFLQFFAEKYLPENVVIAVAGNFEEGAMLEKIAKVFGEFSGNNNISAAADVAKAVYTPGFSIKEKDIEQVHLCMGYPGLASGDSDIYALAMVNTILGGGMSSRLFQKIREQHGLVYSVYSYNAGYVDTGLFTIYAALNPNQLQEVMHLISQEVQGMFTSRVTIEQLAKTKEQLKSNFLLSLESSSARMNSIGRSLLMLDRVLTPDELVAKIDNVDMTAFYRACETVFKMDQVSVSLVGKSVERLAETGLADM